MTAGRRLGRRGLLIVAGLVGLAGCADAPEPIRSPPPSYAQSGQLRLAVARIDVVDEHRPPRTPPHFEHRMPVVPAAALRRWAQARLVADGGARPARFVIRDARVIEIELPRRAGFAAAFAGGDVQRYDLSLAAHLEILDPRDGLVVAVANAGVNRSQNIGAQMTVAQRESLLRDLVERTVAEFDTQFERAVRAQRAAFLEEPRPEPPPTVRPRPSRRAATGRPRTRRAAAAR